MQNKEINTSKGKHAVLAVRTLDSSDTAVTLAVAISFGCSTAERPVTRVLYPSLSEQARAMRRIDYTTLAWWVATKERQDYYVQEMQRSNRISLEEFRDEMQDMMSSFLVPVTTHDSAAIQVYSTHFGLEWSLIRSLAGNHIVPRTYRRCFWSTWLGYIQEAMDSSIVTMRWADVDPKADTERSWLRLQAALTGSWHELKA